MRLIAAATLVLALAGQQPPSDQPIRSAVDLVRVDVSAVDGRGHPIPNLRAEDFELRVDGRPRSIASVQFVRVSADADTPAREAGHYSSNVGATLGRLIMIAIDRTSLTTGRTKSALKAASEFVHSLNHADRVALATIPEGPQVTFTADHALVQRLILGIEGTALESYGTRNIGIADALAFERKNDLAMQLVIERECGTSTAGGGRGGSSELMLCQNDVKAEALDVAAGARARARQTLVGLQALLKGFPPSQTPKILVFISEGLVIQGEPSPLAWLDARAAEAHVTIYAVRLESSGTDASQRRPPASLTADRTVHEHGLSALAQATGGDLFRIISNSDFAFDRLSSELSGYYLLGFAPDPQERDGQPHAISVDVRRRGVTVRSRRQFTIPVTTTATADDEIVAALRDPLPAVDIPLSLTTYAFPDARPDQMRLFLAAEFDRAAADAAQMSVGYVVVDFDGKLVTSRMDAELPSGIEDQTGNQVYLSGVSVAPGKYTVKLAAVDGAGRRGSVERLAHAELSDMGPVRATELLLGQRAAPGWALPLTPAVTGEIAGGTLHGYLELFADRVAAFEHVRITFEIAKSESSAALAAGAVQLSTPEDNVRARVASVRVDVARLSPGDYVARAVVAYDGKTVGQVSRPFRIPRPAASGERR